MMNPLESVASWADDEPSLCPGPKLVPLCATFDVESFIERHGLKVPPWWMGWRREMGTGDLSNQLRAHGRVRGG